MEKVVIMGEERITISIRKDLYEKIKKEIEDSDEFKSPEEFIEFVLEQVLEEEEEEASYSEEEEEEIKERLRSLGYL